MKDQGFIVLGPFEKQVADDGNDAYNGTVSSSNGQHIYTAYIEMTGTAKATATMYEDWISTAKDLGYVTQRENDTSWAGYDSRADWIMYVREDTANGWVMQLWEI
jgi:hypothetical protein